MREHIDQTDNHYVGPHKKISRLVVDADVPLVLSDGTIMAEMCHGQRGIYPYAYAIAHSQMNDIEPLRFFVDMEGNFVINPVILEQSGELKETEGCMTFPDKEVRQIHRAHKILVKYQIIEDGKLVTKTARYANLRSRVFQHEIDHMDGKYIYD